MCARFVPAILVTALIEAVIVPAEARTVMRGNTTVGNVVVASPGRFNIAPRRFISRPIVVFDRFSGRFVLVDKFGFARFRRLSPFASVDLFGGGDFVEIAPPFLATAPSPSIVVSVPLPSPAIAPSAPLQAASLPPCRETTPEGVVIERGTACSRTPP